MGRGSRCRLLARCAQLPPTANVGSTNAACRPLVDPTRLVRTLLPAFGLTALLPPQRQRAQAPSLDTRRTSRFPLAILLLTLGLFLIHAAHVRAAEKSVAWPETKQYGTAGPGKILFFIKGQVARPGRYYVEKGATMAELPKLAGGFRVCEECKRLPSIVTLYSERNPTGKKDYNLADVEVLATVRLIDGDRVTFWHYRL